MNEKRVKPILFDNETAGYLSWNKEVLNNSFQRRVNINYCALRNFDSINNQQLNSSISTILISKAFSALIPYLND